MREPVTLPVRLGDWERMGMDLDEAAPGLTVATVRLPGDWEGLYCAATDTILIDERLTDIRRRCALVHELVHRAYGDDTSAGWAGAKAERRARVETARLLVSPAEYALAERTYGPDPWLIANELGVTVQVITDYRTWGRG